MVHKNMEDVIKAVKEICKSIGISCYQIDDVPIEIEDKSKSTDENDDGEVWQMRKT